MYLNVSARLTRFLTVVGIAAILAGCGQGSGPQRVPGTPQAPQSGVLLDSPVSGVSYVSSSGESGITNADGEFEYLPFDLLTFSVGGIELGTVNGADIITVVELTGSPNPNTRAAVNMLVFLQSIDSDGDPANGITISSEGIAQAASLRLDFNSANFANEIGAVVAAIAGPNATVVSEADALSHFYDTYAQMGGTSALSFPFPGFPPVGPGSDIYLLKFADEFDTGDAPAAENWTIETGYGPNNDGWGNNEWQQYTTSPDNVRVEDGNLVLEARCDTPPCGSRDGSITSGKINSLNKFNFKYGKVVARIKPPVGQGSWPAFWALGTNFPDIGWPRSGEIDFMEMFPTVSNDRTTHSTIHWCDETIQAPDECSFPEGRVFFGQSRSFLNSLGEDFQVWEADWSEERITVAINGVSYFSRDIDATTMEEFLEEFYLILNVAMGGTLGSDNQPPSGSEIWPQTMLVDYVRVYQSTGSTSSEVRIIDFEEPAENYSYGPDSGFGGGAAGVIPNPVIDDINPSAQVSVMRKFEAEVFGGASLDLQDDPIFVTPGSVFTVKVWSPREVPVTFKIEGASPIERRATHTGSGWEELSFDFGSYSGQADALTFIFDIEVLGDATNNPDDWTFYFDDIVFTPLTGGDAPTGEDDFPIDFEESVETYNFGAEGGFGGGAVSVLPNPVAGGINDSPNVARMLKFEGEPFAGSLLTLAAPLDVAANSRFTMKVWSPRPVRVLFKLEGETDAEIDINHTGSGWEELTYNFGSYSGSVGGLSFIFDLGIVGDATNDPANWTFYFDDITYFSGDDIDVDTTAPTLTSVSLNSSNANSAFAAAGDTVTVTITADEPIFIPVVTISGIAATDTTGTGTMWQASRTLTAADAEGPVTFSVAYSDISNNAGQVVTAATDATSVTFDVSAPALTIEGLSAASTTLDPAVVTFQFNENVSGFEASDIAVTNGAISGFASSDDATYTATVTPAAEGELVVSVAAGAAQDAAGNTSSAANVISVIDSIAPAVLVQGVPAEFATLDPIAVTVQFSEMVTGFDVTDIQVANGSVSNFVPLSGTTYTASVTPDGAGNLTVSVAAGAAQDLAGNFSLIAADVISLIDGVAPTVAIEGVPADFATLDVIAVTFQFSEAVTDFTVDDIQVTNGTAAGFVAVDEDTYTADITPDGAGNLTVAVAAGAAQDGVGNPSVVSMGATSLVDAVAPTVTVSGVPADFATLAPITVTFQFSEAVTGFTVDDIQVTNGSAAGFVAVDDDTYTAEITPDGAGDLAVAVAADAAQDGVGNSSVAAVGAVSLVDAIAPTVVIEGLPGTFETLDPITVTFQFSEAVSGFTVDDIQVTNGSAAGFMAVDEDTYTAEITPDGAGAGDLTVSVAAGAAQDGVGNPSVAAVDAVSLVDAVAPTVIIEGVPANFETLDPITVTFQFSEAVSGFTIDDIQVTNGSAGSFIVVDEDTYTAVITPDGAGAGDLTVSVAADAAQDGVGNSNTPAADAVSMVDAIAPTVVIQGAPADFTTNAPFTVTVQFSEAVSGFTIADIQVTNGARGSFTVVDAATYTASITPDLNGDLTIAIAAAAAQDGVGNASVAAASVVVLNNVDTQAPRFTAISIASTNANPAFATVGDIVTVTMTSNEDIIEPTVLINGVAADTVTGAGVSWQATRAMTGNDAEGLVTFTLDLEDLEGNPGLQFTVTTDGSEVTFDLTSPTVTINGLPADFDTLDPLAATFQFSEAVTGFTVDDIQVANGSVGGFMAVDEDTYTAAITPDGAGDLTVSVASGAAQDGAGNSSVAAVDAVSLVDAVAPTVVVQGAPADFTTDAPFTITVQFSEAVSGFAIADIQVTNGQASSFTVVDAATYTASITPDLNGDLTIDIGAAAAQDGVGNASVAATSVVVLNNVDTEAPTFTNISIASNNANPAFATEGDVVTVSMTADEEIIEPTVSINGVAADTVTGAGVSWQATRTLLVSDTDGSIGFAIDFEDLVGNPGVQVTMPTDASSVTLDSTAPTLDITGLAATFTTDDPIALTFTFSEDVTGFQIGDVAVTNGALDALVEVDAATYTANVTPDGLGDLTVSVAAGAAADAAGNTSEAATETSTEDLQPLWSLVWSDDFDSPTLDTTNWTVRTDADCPAPCDGVQSYEAGNVTIVGGVLTITAQENAGPAYVSGLIDSRGKREYKYGRIEIDARMPGTLGAAPALMMLPTSDVYGTWPLSGEIDIAKALDLGVAGNANVEQALVYGLPTPENTETAGVFAATAPDTSFITYAIEWEEGEVRWFVGDTHVLTQTQGNWYAYPEDENGVYGVAPGAAPFDEDFYLTLSLAIDDSADVTSVFPQSLEIDAVRVFECENAIDPVAGTGCSTGDPGVTPVMAADGPFTQSLDVYVDGLTTVGFVDEAMTTTMSTLVTVTETSDGSVVVMGDTAAVDPEGGTIWNLDISAAMGVADILVQPDTFAGMNGSFNLTGGGTAGEILFRMRVNSVMGTPTLTVGMEDNAVGSGESALVYAADGQWKQFSVKISDVVTDSVMNATTLDLASITNLFKLSATGGSINLDIDDIEVKVSCRDTDGCEVTPTLSPVPDVVRYFTDFESTNPATTTRIGSGWRYFNNVFAGTPSTVQFFYNGLAPNGPQISALATDQGGPTQGNVQLSVYSDYECCFNPTSGHQANSPTDILEVNVFREEGLVAADVGKTLTYSFDVKRGNIGGSSVAYAFIQVLDPLDGFSVTDITRVETTNTSLDWVRVEMELVIGDWAGQRLQFGFQTLSSQFENAGVFYDNIEVTESAP